MVIKKQLKTNFCVFALGKLIVVNERCGKDWTVNPASAEYKTTFTLSPESTALLHELKTKESKETVIQKYHRYKVFKLQKKETN